MEDSQNKEDPTSVTLQGSHYRPIEYRNICVFKSPKERDIAIEDTLKIKTILCIYIYYSR